MPTSRRLAPRLARSRRHVDRGESRSLQLALIAHSNPAAGGSMKKTKPVAKRKAGGKRYRLRKGTQLAADVVQGLGETNCGDPEVLYDFLAWGTKTYPAQHYLVSLWNHGAGWDDSNIYEGDYFGGRTATDLSHGCGDHAVRLGRALGDARCAGRAQHLVAAGALGGQTRTARALRDDRDEDGANARRCVRRSGEGLHRQFRDEARDVAAEAPAEAQDRHSRFRRLPDEHGRDRLRDPRRRRVYGRLAGRGAAQRLAVRSHPCGAREEAGHHTCRTRARDGRLLPRFATRATRGPTSSGRTALRSISPRR